MATVTNLLCDSRLADLCNLKVIHNAKTTREGRSFLAGVGAQVGLLGRIIKSLSGGRNKITHIHTCSGFTFFRDCLHALVARGLGSEVVWHVHGARFDKFLAGLPGPGKRLARGMLTRSGGVIVLSNQWIRTLQGFAPQARWRAVPNGVAVPDVPSPVERNHSLLFLGNLGQRKGASDLVEALIRARQKCPEVCGKLAGNETAPGERLKLSKRIRQSPHPEAVELIGIVKGQDKLERLEQAGLFCLPSYAEGLPMAMLEAMASGLGVIVTRVGAIPEVITDGVEGFLVDPGDVETLSDRILRLSEDGQLRKTMGAAARRKVIQHYSLDRMAERIYGLYQEVTRRR
jgi:glycosyltransferase involved in cell wall biosynthesis